MEPIIDGHTHLNQFDPTLHENIENYFQMAKKENVKIDKAVVCLSPHKMEELFIDEKIIKLNTEFDLKSIHPKLTTDLIPYFYIPYSPGELEPGWLKDLNYSEYVTELKNIGFKGLKFHC